MTTATDAIIDVGLKMKEGRDVTRVLALEPTSKGRFRYLIETPHDFPKFVIGTTDAECDDVRHLFKCNQLESAQNAWKAGKGK